MKSSLLTTLICCFIITNLYSQSPLREYKLNDLEGILIHRYIISCVRDHWFRDNKGVVEINRFINKNGLKSWYLSVVIDDRYKENPPKEYSFRHGDLVFFYDTDENENRIKTEPSPELLASLEKVTFDKLYIRPPKKDQYVEIWGKQVVNHGRQCMGNCANDQIIEFNDDGTYNVKPVF